MRAAQVARIRRASAEDGLLALQQNVGNSAVQRLLEDAPGERRLGPRQVRTLQRAAGNQAVETLLTRPQRVGQTGLQRSVVLAHLQRLHDAARAETPSYRADIASFQRRYSSADIAAHQRTVLGPQSADNSAVLRRKGSDKTAGAVATREGRLKRGPSYTPSGSITAGTSGERQTTRFDFTAEFENDPKKGIYAACCEVRQYIKWSHTPPKHAGFGTGLSADTWYEDRDAVDKRYGHRSGPHSENIPGNQYVNKKGSPDQANGVKYEGNDNPGIKAGSRTGETWDFMVKVIDTCNGDKVLGTDTVSVKW
jgi:hypothetical protein